jgi:hypothetical protein
MAFQAVPDTVEIVVEYTQNGSTMNNVMHAEKVGGYGLVPIQTLAAAVDAAVAASWLPIQTVEAFYTRTTVRGLAVENDIEWTNSVSSGVGGSATAGLPGNVTLSVKKFSALTGRSARGRMYWIGLTGAMLSPNENVLNAADVVAIETAIEAVRLAIQASPFLPVIVSRFTAGAARPVGVTFDWLGSIAVDLNVDSMRTRLL